MYNYLINNLKDRFINRLSIQVITKLEELSIARLNGNHTKVDELIKRIGYETYQKVIDEDVLKSEFRCINILVQSLEVTSLATLVQELKKNNLEYLWLVGRIFKH